ncbi:cyanophycinase [Rufibacter sp. XAAS-G3-1]|uniref:cyanophycinase n=1 Tax=Rufibacter sp. XAAS-G3-1 TaxID=2729134 RepID=UPI0015E7E18D|nr:cyanophycinase [Rufibacter sp. XAAS-G3-1]
MKRYLFYFFLLLTSSAAWAQPSSPKGNLFIIGGGTRSPALIKEMVETAGLQKKDYIVVLPMASAEPVESYAAIQKQLQAVTKNKITCFNFTPATVLNKKWLDSLRQAKLIFITGGSQDRFMQVVHNSPVYTAIHAAYAGGATIAGTSAGAAVMSKYMITGQQLAGDTTYKETFDKLWDKNIEFKPGLALLDSVIIDQHFIKRSRYARLFSALAAFPSFDCVGIDEGTALVVLPGRMKVVGDSQVIHFSEPKGLQTTPQGLIKVQDMKISIYADGDYFSF